MIKHASKPSAKDIETFVAENVHIKNENSKADTNIFGRTYFIILKIRFFDFWGSKFPDFRLSGH